MGLIPVLTTIIGTVARGKAAKAIAGGLSGAVTSIVVSNDLVGKVVSAFSGGATEALVPQAHDLGFALAQALAGYVVGHVVVWLAPKNEPSPKNKPA